MKRLLLKLLEATSFLALVLTVVDVNTFCCFGIFHQPKLPKTADKLKIK